jgi:hypothetical protein
METPAWAQLQRIESKRSHTQLSPACPTNIWGIPAFQMPVPLAVSNVGLARIEGAAKPVHNRVH